MIDSARRKLAMLVIALATQAVTACVNLRLGDGRETTLGAASAAMRDALVISREGFPGSLRYQPVERCEFFLLQASFRRDPVSVGMSVSVRRVGEYLFLNATSSFGDSTALFDFDGRLLDFNIVDLSTRRRTTSESYPSDAETELNRLGRSSDIHFINFLRLFTPHYRSTALRVGEVAAVVLDETNQVWGKYIYMGTANFGGLKVLVLDLVHSAGGSVDQGALVVGFTLIDPKNMLPVVSTVESGALVRLRRTTCRGERLY
jgi:hypothetical protein